MLASSAMARKRCSPSGFGRSLHVAIQPAVGDALVSGSAGFHVVLRVEMRARSCRVTRRRERRPDVLRHRWTSGDSAKDGIRRIHPDRSPRLPRRCEAQARRSAAAPRRSCDRRRVRPSKCRPQRRAGRWRSRSADLCRKRCRSLCQGRANQKRRRRGETCHRESCGFQKITP